MLLLRCLLVALLVATAAAYSSGDFAGFCDVGPASATLYGPGGIMPWVEAPTYSADYTVRTGNGLPEDDPTTYTPNTLVPIYVSTLKIEAIFIGFMMYAVDENNTRVGEWAVGANNHYHTTCDGTAVSHKNAELKPIDYVFYWIPPEGARNVTFAVMIKHGEQNHGDFYWPAAVPVLSEGAPHTGPGTPLVLGDHGMSCEDVCAEMTDGRIYCNEEGTAAAIDALDTKEEMVAATTAMLKACRNPIVGGCSVEAPSEDPDGFCTFKLPECPLPENGTAATACNTAVEGARRFCHCTDEAPPVFATTMGTGGTIGTSTGPAGTSTGLQGTATGVSAAPRTSPLLLAVAPLLYSLGSLRPRNALAVCAALLLLAPHAAAHNYVFTPSRARISAVTVPCQRRVHMEPHVQVNPGQKFQLQWATGHGDSRTTTTYFVAVKAENLERLRWLEAEMIDDYLDNAPTEAVLTGTEWEKRHTSRPGQEHGDGFYDEIFSGDADYIPLDPVMQDKSLSRVATQYKYRPEHVATDKRAAYFNPDYPYIEAADRFVIPFNTPELHSIYASQYDLANFTLPARAGSGDYIYWFKWGGYKDCVDINVQPETVPVPDDRRYGIPEDEMDQTFVKVDHCEINNVPNPRASTPCQVIPARNASACLAACQDDGGCTHVQVVRATAPDGTLPYTPNIPYAWFNSETDIRFREGTEPCMKYRVHNRVTQGCTDPNPTCDPAIGAGPDDFVCYGVRPTRNQDFQVEEDFIIIDDPKDPRFYSTCYVKTNIGGFLPFPKPPPPPPVWAVGDSCIDCAFNDEVATLPLEIVPDWVAGLTDVCRNCDRD